ncbi:hypothetical protein L3Q82_020941 [Scortum barcoo]|uniref:Uncharacterized protein n=1 Tax=Scortum barcoo TaxID=214431 RepID=A0ACB8V989_9TELE|nr:hypothetical protein L3Q82_020941 [Scortum barcoo]
MDVQVAEQAGIPSEPVEKSCNAAVDSRVLAIAPFQSPSFSQGATIFTKVDLQNTYHLVRICDGDEWNMAFNTPLGHFEYWVIPFSLTNAPAIFQALINDVLCVFLIRFVFVYLGDILICSRNLPDHQLHVCQVLQRLLENSLFFQEGEMRIPRPQISFLWFILREGRVQPDPEKEAAPLTALTSPSLYLDQGSGESLQPTKNPVAFDVRVGAVLSQRQGPEAQLHPCTFSRRLSPAEANYNVGNWELLEEWRHWLEGSTQPFMVWTYHKNLAYIQTTKRLNSHQARWSLFSCFNFAHLQPQLPKHQARRSIQAVQHGGEDSWFHSVSLPGSPVFLLAYLPLSPVHTASAQLGLQLRHLHTGYSSHSASLSALPLLRQATPSCLYHQLTTRAITGRNRVQSASE